MDENTETHEVDACPRPLSYREPESYLTAKPVLTGTCYKPPKGIDGDGQRPGQAVVRGAERPA